MILLRGLEFRVQSRLDRSEEASLRFLIAILIFGLGLCHNRKSAMKRASIKRMTALRSHDIRRDLKESQLADIGAVALAYNEVEAQIDVLMASALELYSIALEVTSRINGVDGKIEIIKAAVAALGASPEFKELLADSLGGTDGFMILKQYRDAVIHARDIDSVSTIGATAPKRGKLYEVLLTPTALKSLYDRLLIVRSELVHAQIVILKLSTIRRFQQYEMGIHRGFLASPAERVIPKAKAQHEQDILGVTAQYREHQNRRRSLLRFPEFPSEQELRQAHLDWLQAQISEQAAAFRDALARARGLTRPAASPDKPVQ